ncbi:putative lipid-binding transport protein (Tim44 family) [Rhizobium sp. SG_E_25_P2]|uniref:Tim44/TimA family putative adaptor protein n=1 Tax=Rhizobium sp. SG_E_25_P2 TaxID=2879942 RepID=UPI0024743577|nr:Tim44/TimA family putative adaptor protein [Rhizobium sp. SG_E_25_P2]MDH6269334.1 putative lipid-binding transport protein (Tim44 family) [Rhizobium sp. SG_E_25_P2]
MGTDSIITLFFLIVAALIFLNLRSVLGKRTGHEKPPYDPLSPRETARETQKPQSSAEDGKVVTLPRRGAAEPENRYHAIDAFAPPGSPLNETLRRVFDADPSFDPQQFAQGAQAAYEMIVTAYAEGDRKTLKNLLSSEVYEGFNAAIAEREKAGEKVKFSFVGIDKAEMVGASIEGAEVTITMKIVSQLISATYDKAGTLVDGNADDVSEVKDRWTFLRDTRSRDPNWKLVSTQSEG